MMNAPIPVSPKSRPFNLVRLEIPGGLSDFMVDNINVSTIRPLTISRTRTNTALLAWPAASPSCGPQQIDNLTTNNWVVATNVVTTVNATNNQVILFPLSGNVFFRLLHP